MLKILLFVAFGAGTLLDLLVNVLGVAIILQAQSVLVYAISVITAVALTCLRLCMETIFHSKGLIYIFLKAAFVISLLVSFASSFNALAAYVLFRKPMWTVDSISVGEIIHADGNQMKIVVFLIVLYLVTSPLFTSYLFREYFEQRDQAEEEEEKAYRSAVEKRESAPKVPPILPTARTS